MHTYSQAYVCYPGLGQALRFSVFIWSGLSPKYLFVKIYSCPRQNVYLYLQHIGWPRAYPMNKDHYSASASMIQTIQHDPETSGQILKAIFDSTKSSIFLIAPDYRLLFFNKWASDGCKLLYGREMFIGDSILNYRRSNDEAVNSDFREDFQQAIATKELVVREREMVHPEMNYWVRLEHTPVYDDDQRLIGVLLNVINISDRKKIEIQNQQQHNQLIKIAWTQSHETRQPLASMLGLINILDKKNLSADNLEIITLLEGTALKLEKIIQQTVIMANDTGS